MKNKSYGSLNNNRMIKKLLLIVLIAFFSIDTNGQINEFTKNMQLHEGLFNYYWDNKTGKIYLQINQLNEEFLYINYLSAGVGSNDIGLDRGQIGDSRIVYFAKVGPKVMLIQPNYKFRASTNDNAERKSVEDAFAKSILWGFVISKEEEDKVLVDATSFLMRDSHGIIPRLKRQNQGNYDIDSSRSSIYLEMTKNFPKNTEFEAQITYKGSSPGSWLRSVVPSAEVFTIRTHHSFVELPKSGYKPRKFDPRSGYGALTYYDYSVPISQSIEQKIIRRHRLEKKHPNREISEAKKPIIYYLDRGTPEPIKSALVEGASWWNDSYEEAGFKNAFQIKIMPEGADMLDIRYNVIQWVHRSTRGWSYGSSVVDPRTGEIIKGHVTLGSLRVRQDYLIAEGLLRPYDDPVLVDKMEKMAIKRLKQLSAHEVGHTLGLSHNYISSARERKSVMDYPHPLIKLNKNNIDLTDSYDSGIGEWDKIAINWGYREFHNEEELNGLENILQEGYKKNIYFITDQDSRPASSAHPRAHLWDNGFDAAEELDRMLKIRRHVLDNLSDNVIKQGEPMSSIEEALVPMFLLHRYQIEAAAKVIGGLEYNYALKGDGQLVTKMLPFTQQVKALESLLNSIHPNNLSLPENLIQLIPPRAFGYPRTRETFKSRTGLTFDYLAAAETATNLTLKMLLNPERASRLLTLKARDLNQPGFGYILRQIIDETILNERITKDQSGSGSNVEIEIAKMVNHTVLNHLFILANSKKTHEEVNARTHAMLKTLKKLLDKKQSDNYHYSYLSGKIEKFLSGEVEIEYPDELKPPDGSPIGSYENLLFSCGSEL